MRKSLTITAALIVALIGAWALAGGINLDPAKRYQFLNCSATGSIAVTVPGGVYFTRVTDESVNMCLAESSNTDGGVGAGCSSDGGFGMGDKLPAGLAMMLSIGNGGQSVSCRSAGATGDLMLTGATQ